ncbi:MAG: hypothetical protein HYT85_07440 [candidate division NC10 bacterium]|nr:hypothetical protein [candidate division NC10 bacterium]MBI2454840.1 hypothetical protein [candidate division NC10 bacterium]MBI2562573.1 hypothetical protein [candidate division NC10 bacterium]MBI3084605.1 hypothetical protein [candidate division NC10 bacterium]
MSTLLTTIVYKLLQAGIILIFPAVALRAWRNGGTRRLASATIGALVLISAFALAAAGEWSGNRLTATYGYGYIAGHALLLFGLTLGLPVLAAAAVIRAWKPTRGTFLRPYSIAVLAAVGVWAGASVLGYYVMAAIP